MCTNYRFRARPFADFALEEKEIAPLVGPWMHGELTLWRELNISVRRDPRILTSSITPREERPKLRRGLSFCEQSTSRAAAVERVNDFVPTFEL